MEPDYHAIVESIGEGLILLDANGRIEYTNSRLSELFGYSKDELLNRSVECLLPRDLREGHRELREGFLRHPQKRPMGKGKMFPAIKKNGDTLKVGIGLNYYKDDQNELKVIAVVTDLTERDRLEKDLHKRRQQAQLYLDLSKSIFLVLDGEGKVKMINREGCHIFGYSEDEVIGKDWFEYFVEPDDRAWLNAVFGKIMCGDLKGVEFVQSRVRCKSGQSKLIEWHNSVIYDEDGAPEGTISSGVDITMREESEKSRTEAMLTGIEGERKRIAGELHDGIVQILCAISLNLKTLEKVIDSSTENNKNAYRDALNLLEMAIGDTRRLSHILMPSMIERYGLIKALEDLAQRMTQFSDLKVEIDPDHVDDQLGEFYRLNIYRIIQELVQNAVKHAKATKLVIKIRRYDHLMQLSVQDDGRGFTGTVEERKDSGIGLKNVITRVKSMNGTFNIDSVKNKGTQIDIHFPLSI